MGRLKWRLLKLIGIVPMTNREALLEELGELDDDAFDRAILRGGSGLPEALSWMKCDDCRARHYGACPHPDDGCAYTMADWFSEPCTRERLLPDELTAQAD